MSNTNKEVYILKKIPETLKNDLLNSFMIDEPEGKPKKKTSPVTTDKKKTTSVTADKKKTTLVTADKKKKTVSVPVKKKSGGASSVSTKKKNKKAKRGFYSERREGRIYLQEINALHGRDNTQPINTIKRYI